MKILKNILTFLLVLLVTAFLAVSSFTFSQENKAKSLSEAITLTRSTAHVMKTELGKSFIEKKPYLTNAPITLDK